MNCRLALPQAVAMICCSRGLQTAGLLDDLGECASAVGPDRGVDGV